MKNKTAAGRSNRSLVCKTKKTGFQGPSSKAQAPLETPSGKDDPAVPPDLQSTAEGQLGFPDRVYWLASIIFQNNHLEKPAAQRLVNYGKERGLPVPAVKDEEMQHRAYELAFNTLKCEFFFTSPVLFTQLLLLNFLHLKTLSNEFSAALV